MTNGMDKFNPRGLIRAIFADFKRRPKTWTEAVERSAEKWEMICDFIDGLDGVTGVGHCPLCVKNGGVGCDEGCPVYMKTGRQGCDGTPYSDFKISIRSLSALAYAERRFLIDLESTIEKR